MKYKKIMMLAIFFVSLLAISAASAADNTTEVIIANAGEDVVSVENNNQTIEQTENEEIIGETDDGTFTALQNKIDNAESGSTITLENDYYYNEVFSTDGIKINKNLIIEGNGHSLDGLKKSGIFYLFSTEKTQHNLVLKNIKFSNGYSEIGGGAIYGIPNGDSTYSSGFDYEPYRWHLTVDNCTFNNNVAASYGSGGAIRSCDLIISNSIFTNNEASGSGGAIFNSNDWDYEDCLEASNCTFNNNKAVYNGGALDICNGALKNCIFNDNIASDGSGGAISTSKITIDSCTFNSNKANGRIVPTSNSGGVYTYEEYSRDFPGEGGAICAFDDCIIKNSKFTNNEALEYGGSIYLSSYRYDEYEGLIYHNQILENCTFTKNVASKYGGAIYSTTIEGHSAKIMNCTFSENKDSEYNDIAGGIISNCVFKNTVLSASKVTATYGVSKNLLVTLKDSRGNILKSKKVTIKVGTMSKTLTTNDEGQVSVVISDLLPKTYTATIGFSGDDVYINSSAKVSVVVKKATPKITANAKTFKKSDKTKKYTVTLKNNKKLIKGVTVKITVNKKTYSAKTSSKGVATFKLTKLTKKGKFTATVKSVGNKYYNAKTLKNIKITVK